MAITTNDLAWRFNEADVIEFTTSGGDVTFGFDAANDDGEVSNDCDLDALGYGIGWYAWAAEVIFEAGGSGIAKGDTVSWYKMESVDGSSYPNMASGAISLADDLKQSLPIGNIVCNSITETDTFRATGKEFFNFPHIKIIGWNGTGGDLETDDNINKFFLYPLTQYKAS